MMGGRTEEPIPRLYSLAVWGHTLYPFTAPPIIPETKNLRKTNAATAGGTTAIIPAAAVSPYCTESFVINSDTTIATGFVSSEEARINGIWNWLHVFKNMIKAADRIIG